MKHLADHALSVYVILDPSVVPPGSDVVAIAAGLAQAGCGVLQVRHKGASGRETVHMTRAILEAVARWPTLVIVNDRVDVALAAGADGVHVGPRDIAVEDIRRVAPSLIVGGSAGDLERAREIQEQGAHYLGCGAVYEARTMKPDASAPRGPAFVRSIVDAVDIPVFGIGGIDEGNVRSVIEAGATGVAVIRNVVAAEDPVAAFDRLRAMARG